MGCTRRSLGTHLCRRLRSIVPPAPNKCGRTQADAAWRYQDRNVAYRRSRTAPTWICLGWVTTQCRMAEPGLPGDHRRERHALKQEEAQGPAVERPLYPTPTSILRRPPTCPLRTATASPIDKDWNHDAETLCNEQELQLLSAEVSRIQIATSRTPGAPSKFSICSTHTVQNQGQGTSNPDQRLNNSTNEQHIQRCAGEREIKSDGLGDCSGKREHIPTEDAPNAHPAPVDLGDEEVCIKEGGDLYAEDVEGHLAGLPEVTSATEEVKIEDIQVGNPNDNTQEQVDRLKHIIWRRRHLLIGKGNDLPPDAKGAICDIDVGNAKPVAQRVRKVAPQFHEKLFQLIKWLLSAKIIQHSTSP
ncbi:unnamed protein product [Phytophthora fragariaefolia]|uniref:Unnamed protein product n=1 Tax=Phytophthora fragariaefolia TaxID=1490495 RepID=A0A9W7DEW2_9STRA|nr:unnamed protein product [Phytophthora fragariaefolia]